MGNEVTKMKVITSLFWKLIERGGAHVIQFIVLLILARMLLPEDFGLLVIATTFILLANVFVQGGFGVALIQKKQVDDVDFSSVFYLNLGVAALLYSLLFLISPQIALFFEQPILVPVLRVLSLTLFFGAINAVQNAYIARQFAFKKLFISSLTACILSGIAGITLAYAGFGIWALVVQHLVNQFIVTLLLSFLIAWRPKWLFSLQSVLVLYSFGWKLLISSLIDTLYINVQSIVIGKLFSPAVLGFYNRGEQFPSLIVSNINGSIQAVMLPTLANEQDNKLRMKELMRRAIVTSSFILFPMMVGLAVIAEPLVLLLLTDKWLPAVPFLQLFCGIYVLWPIHTANLQAINALGRSDLYLKLEIIKKSLGTVIVIFCIPFGAHAVVGGMLVTGILATFINAAPNRSLLNYRFTEQAKDILPSFLLALIMGAIIFGVHWLDLTALQTIVTQIILGIVIYTSLAWLFRLECFKYIVGIVKDLVRRKKSAEKLVNNEA